MINIIPLPATQLSALLLCVLNCLGDFSLENTGLDLTAAFAVVTWAYAKPGRTAQLDPEFMGAKLQQYARAAANDPNVTEIDLSGMKLSGAVVDVVVQTLASTTAVVSVK